MPNRESRLGLPARKLTAFQSLYLLGLVGVTSCGRLENAAGAATTPWWYLVIGGILFMVFSAFILVKGVDSPGVTVSGPSGCTKETIVISMFLFGGLLLILGALSALFPRHP